MTPAYDKALSLLALREHTEKEIRTKLQAKGYQAADISSAIERLKGENALSEERFAESYIRSRMRRTPEGKEILIMRLISKGTPSSIAKSAVNEYFESGDYLEPLFILYNSLLKKKGEEKALAFLYRKGFSRSEISLAKERDDEK